MNKASSLQALKRAGGPANFQALKRAHADSISAQAVKIFQATTGGPARNIC